MIFRYGGYQHDANEVMLTSVDILPERTEGGAKHRLRETWTIEGDIYSTSPTALTLRLVQLEAAYAIEGVMAAFYEDDGTITKHVLGGPGSLGGCRVMSFRYQGGAGEYVYSRKYSITLEAVTLAAGSSLVLFTERVSLMGGGMEYVWRRPIHPTARPIRQPVGQDTYKATQSGQAVGVFGYPQPMLPLWPGAILPTMTQIERESPKRYGPVGNPYYTEFAVSWSYSFESDAPLIGFPNRWVG